jgi:hypothetical protein
MNRRLASTLSGTLLAAALLFSSSASAATLVGDYQLQGTHSSSGPGTALEDLGAGNTFQSETVMGVSRQVLAFPVDNGLRLNPTGIADSTYSVVMTFRFSDVADYARILDSSNATEDQGFYVNDGKADYYDASGTDHESPAALLSTNAYATVAMTQISPLPASSAIYVNGALAADAPSSDPVISDTLRFFRDDSNPDEESAGAVSCIRVYNGALAAAEVATIGASPTCGAAPATTPSTPITPAKKKCKKHKKKHHRAADSAKKKKCKKKRKR